MTKLVLSLQLLGRVLRLVWATSPGYTAVLLASAVVQGLVPVGRLWIAKLIIDALVAALAGGNTDLRPLVPLVILEFVLTTIGAALSSAAQAVQTALGHLLRVRIGEAVLRVAMSLDFAMLEDPGFHDRLQRAQQEANYRPLNLVMQLSHSLVGLIGLLGTLALLATVDVLAPVALIVLGLPYIYVQARSGQASYFAALFNSPDARRLSYIGSMTASLDVAKEARLFGLTDYLLKSYRDVGQRMLRQTLSVLHFLRSHRDPRGQAPCMPAPSVKPGISASNIAPTADASAAVLAQVDFARHVTSRSRSPISSPTPHTGR